MAAGEDSWLELQYLYYLLVLTKTKLAPNEKTQCNHHSASCLRLIAESPRSHSTYLLMHVIYVPFRLPIPCRKI